MQARPTIHALTGLRGVASLWVVLFHLGPELFVAFPCLRFLSPVAETGYLGVDLFFSLSGFVLARRYEDGVVDGSRYLLRRVARIFPLHVAVLVALTLGALVARPLGFDGFAGHALWRFDAWWSQLFLVQAWYEGPEAWNLPSWSLSCEWAGYLALPFVLPRLRLSPARAGLALLLPLAGLAVGLHFFGGWNLGLRGGMWRFAVDFMSGVLLWRATQHHPRLGPLAELLALAIPVAVCFAPEPMLLVPMLVLWPAAIAGSQGRLARSLARPPLLRLGRVSFALYLVHEAVSLVVVSLWPVESLGSSAERAAWLAALIGGVFIATAAGYLAVEKPAHRWLTQLNPSLREARR